MKKKKRTLVYLILTYCSFNGNLILNNKWYIGGLYGTLYLNNTLHIFTEKYKDKIRKISKILKNTKIYNKDFTKILEKAKKGDFVFLDPPYIEDKKYSFNYNKDEVFDNDFLKKELDELTKKKVKWMMTQIDSPQIRKLFKKYKFKTYVNISNFKSPQKTKKKELIITNY